MVQVMLLARARMRSIKQEKQSQERARASTGQRMVLCSDCKWCLSEAPSTILLILALAHFSVLRTSLDLYLYPNINTYQGLKGSFHIREKKSFKRDL